MFLVEGTDESKSLNGVHYFIFVEGQDIKIALCFFIERGTDSVNIGRRCILLTRARISSSHFFCLPLGKVVACGVAKKMHFNSLARDMILL